MPVHPLRAESAQAASLVIDYAEQIGLISAARCESSPRAVEVIVSKAHDAFQVVLVRRPEWCAAGTPGSAPQAGVASTDRFEWAVRRSDLRLLRERTTADLYRHDGLLYGPGGLTVEEQARLAARAELVQKWQGRFAARPAPAQEAFHARKLVLGMSREDLELLATYLKDVGEVFSLIHSGVREELGNKKRELWLFCKPDCLQQKLEQQAVIQDGVVTIIQSVVR